MCCSLVRPYSFQVLGVDKTKKKKACDSIRRSKFKFRSSHINGPLKLFSLSLVVNFLYGDIVFFAPKIWKAKSGVKLPFHHVCKYKIVVTMQLKFEGPNNST